MAGAGYKLFNTGDVLSATDVNTYLQQQAVMVFASAAARTTALASVLAEGMVTYLKDTDSTEYYNGSAWVGVGTSPLTTKGDLYTYSTTNARLGVGTNGQTLTADSTAVTGLKWATASTAPTGWTLLNAGGTTLSGAATITVSSLSAKQMLVLVTTATGSAAAPEVYVRPNNLTTSIYNNFGIMNTFKTTYTVTNYNNFAEVATNVGIRLLNIGGVANGGSGYVFIDTCDQTGTKLYQSAGSGQGNSADFKQYTTAGTIAAGAAITSMSITVSSGTFTGGTMYVYGAN